jgi:hypothetical protein
MKIEMHGLCLLKFQDDKIVLREEELNKIKDAIADGLQKQKLFTGAKPNRESRDGFEIYSLDSKKIGSYLSAGATINSAEIGYYHHRVIVHLISDSADDFSKLREVRDKLKQLVDEMIEQGVRNEINALTRTGKISKEARVEFFYTYPLIVVEKSSKRSEAFPFSEETSSLCFDIVEPSWVRPSGKRHMMRVSIPSTVLYTQGKVGRDLVRDIINAIYQYCLYEKKSMDVSKNSFKNVLDENLLANLWTQIVDRMGGRTIEVHTIRLTHVTYFLALSAFILSIISLTVSLILR